LQVAVEFVKDQLKPIVAELLIDRTQVRRGENDVGLPHLTCTEVADEELPWIVKAQARDTEARKAAEAARAKVAAEAADHDTIMEE